MNIHVPVGTPHATSFYDTTRLTTTLERLPAGYHLMDRAGLYQWGPDVPDDFFDTRMTPSRLLRLIRRSLKDRSYLRKMMGLQKALAQPVRAWRS
jgi:hypothetical protein